MRKSLYLLFTLALCLSTHCHAQRRQHLGRGVVATYSSSTGVMISWRRLIQDDEQGTYNIYVAKPGTTDYGRINATPTNLTNYSTSLSEVPDGATIYVTSVTADGKEGTPSLPFTFRKINVSGNTINNGFFSVNYKEAGSPVYNHDGLTFTTKYCWPVDLDGDGEMEYVVSRSYSAKNQNGYEGWGDDHLGGDCIEAYSREGSHLWTVSLGLHFFCFEGQNDGITVGDFDGDGKGEVIAQVCEGARFWNPEKKDFDKYLYYNGEQASHNGSGTETVASDGSSPDIDGDGICNYTWYDKGKNPQWYFVVINGLTGEQKDVVAMTLPSDKDMTYTRINKSAFMGDEYSYLSPAMGTAYLDGRNQSAVAQYQCRTSNGTHHYFTHAYGYEEGIFKEKWIFKFHDYNNLSQFHHIRIGDVDGDGKDEVMNGQCAVDNDGKLLWTSGIAHGDRFRMSDIDPDHPGIEIFAIQQSASDMLGQILYDATDGSAIKKWYLSSVGDVGRGECMDVDPNHKGYEMWSTMPNIYNAKGDIIGTSKPWPCEGIWWDDDLGREELISSGSGNNCAAIIAKYDGTDSWKRILQISRDANYVVCAEYGVRPMFWGDIYGDWREELILKQNVNGEECGFVALTTNIPTKTDNIYTLLQDPNYYGQITNRGYYQSPNTGFYLGYDMPRPQLPPFIQEDENNEIFDLTSGNTKVLSSNKSRKTYFMPVKGQTIECDSLSGAKEVWKSQQGTLIINGDNTAKGNTIISEGTLELNGNITGTVDLRARGTLCGNGSVGNIIFEGALNKEGGRIIPNNVLTVNNSLCVDNTAYIYIETNTGAHLSVKGDLNVTAPIFLCFSSNSIQTGEYTLIEYAGEFTGAIENFTAIGLNGVSYSIINKDKAIKLVVNSQREPSDNVVWTGEASNIINYTDKNFACAAAPSTFVAGDSIIFTDNAKSTSIIIPEPAPIGSATFRNNSKTYTISGQSGFSGTGSVIFNGTGKVVINNTKNDYTGKTIINSGTVTIKELADAGVPSSIGASKNNAENTQIGKATLIINNTSSSTNRGIMLNDTATIQIASGVAAFRGIVTGTGTLRKTGNGQLNITYGGSNSWAATILEAGTLAMGTWNTTFGKTTSEIHVTGNSTITMFDCNSSSTMPNVQNVINIDEGKTLTFHAGSRCKISGSLRGSGTFKIDFPYVRGDVYTNTSNFKGIYEVTSENCRFVQAMDLSKATLKLDAEAYASGFKAGNGSEVSYTHKIGTLTGTGTLGTGVWQISRLMVNYTASHSDVACDAVTINGTSVFNNPIIELKSASLRAIPDNAELTVIKGSGNRTVTGSVTVIPERPKEGWEWDTSRLAAEGVIRVVPASSGIRTTEAKPGKGNKIYDLQGRRVTGITNGINIVNGNKILK